ncbi:MAG: VOC family protein [Patescibacteria group bacterium]
MNTRVEWIILVTKSYKAMKAFYAESLAFPIKRDVPDEEFTQFKLKNCNLAIYGKQFVEKLLGKKNMGTPGGAIYSFGESDNIDLLYQQLRDKGVQFMKAPETQPWGQRTAYFTDPDGNIWEIQQWIKKPI